MGKADRIVCSIQYYAGGDAWHLPDGAYETIIHLKDAGGHIYQVFSLIGH